METATELLRATIKGEAAIVKTLLNVDTVDLNEKDTGYGRTPLIWAVITGNEEIVKLLIGTQKADSNIADYTGHTALAWAVIKKNEVSTLR